MMCGCVLCLHKQESLEQETFPIYGFVPTVVSVCVCVCGWVGGWVCCGCGCAVCCVIVNGCV